MTHRKGFTLIELLVVISIIALLIGILLPALGAARRTARQIQNSTQLRGIHQGQVIYAQSNKTGSTEGYYAGLDADGSDAAAANTTDDDFGAASNATISNAFAILLNNNAFTPEYIINPTDTIKTQAEVGDDLDDGYHSYAGLQYQNGASFTVATNITEANVRNEWRETINTQAIILADRLGGDNGDQADESVWSDNGWRGTMTRNDGSTGFESSPEVADGTVKYQNSTNDGAITNIVDSEIFMYN